MTEWKWNNFIILVYFSFITCINIKEKTFHTKDVVDVTAVCKRYKHASWINANKIMGGILGLDTVDVPYYKN